MVVEGEVLNDFPRFVGVLIAEFVAGGAVNLTLKMKGDMIVENLDLKPAIDTVMREFLENRVVRSSHVEMDLAERHSIQLLASLRREN
ncbi:hypothetical protein Tco_0222078 [Tanacetum coccineum]